MTRPQSPPDITPDILLRAYSIGLFPMAEHADDAGLFWVDPEERGIFPLDGLLVSRSLRKAVRAGVFEVSVDRAFPEVLVRETGTSPSVVAQEAGSCRRSCESDNEARGRLTPWKACPGTRCSPMLSGS